MIQKRGQVGLKLTVPIVILYRLRPNDYEAMKFNNDL